MDKKSKLTYEILTINDQQVIMCLVCGWSSYNTKDIKQLYCGHCHQWHEPATGAGLLSFPS